MNEAKLVDLLGLGEGLDVEFNSAEGGTPIFGCSLVLFAQTRLPKQSSEHYTPDCEHYVDKSEHYEKLLNVKVQSVRTKAQADRQIFRNTFPCCVRRDSCCSEH